MVEFYFFFFFYAGHLLRIRLIYERTLKRVTIESLNLYLIKKKKWEYYIYSFYIISRNEMGGEKKATAAAAGKRLIFWNIYIYKRCNVTRVCSEPALPASLDFSLPRTLVIILYCWPGLFHLKFSEEIEPRDWINCTR